MSKVELYERIRKEHDAGVSIRELSRRHRVHRRDVRAAIADPQPAARKVAVRERPALGPHEEVVRQWLRDDRSAPRKQRHTARRVWQRLVEEKHVGVAESTVRALVAELKVEVGLDHREVMVPQTHAPGEEPRSTSVSSPR